MAIQHLVALPNRAVLTVRGLGAVDFLQGLLTTNVEAIPEGEARYGALLTPQGKILADMLIVAGPDGLLLDVPAARAPDVLQKLKLYRLRAKIAIEDESANLRVYAAWPDATVTAAVAARDPRNPGLGWRLYSRQPMPAPEPEAVWRAHRIALGIPEGGEDFVYGDAFPHEANLDILHGVDFKKGCYVGQEVVSRVHHRGSNRKRVMRVRFPGEAQAGTPVVAGEAALGSLGSSIVGEGLAMLRIDRLADARSAGVAPTLGGRPIEIVD